jgi:flagellar hook-basal body complex protein FliE
MVANIADAISSYGKAAGLPQMGGGADAATGGVSFSDFLQQAGQNLMDTQVKAEQAGQSAASGKANLVQVMTAISNAETTLQTVVNIRDRLVTAIQDVMRTAV